MRASTGSAESSELRDRGLRRARLRTKPRTADQLEVTGELLDKARLARARRRDDHPASAGARERRQLLARPSSGARRLPIASSREGSGREA